MATSHMLITTRELLMYEGTPDAMKVACPVWIGGKSSDNIKALPIDITIVVGAPGSGKTFFLLNIAANALGIGQKVIVIDPKNDFDKLLNVNPNIDIVDIENIKPDALNPMEFLKRHNADGTVEFIDTATLMTIIEIMTGKLDQGAIIAITPIVTDFVTRAKQRGEYVNMLDVANYLFANPNENAQQIGTQLKMFEDNKYGPLMFASGAEGSPLELSATRSMIITLHGLDMPDYNKSVNDYTPSERLTSAILFVITKKLLEILTQDSKIPTVLICDEAHLLFSNKEMAQVIDKFLVLGRSLNVATVLASQGITHFPDGISNYITSKFMFKSSIDEAEAFLDAFDTSKINPANAIDTNSVLSAVTSFKTGQCFMIDRLGRNGIIAIKSNYDIKLLTSNPLEKQRAAASTSNKTE